VDGKQAQGYYIRGGGKWKGREKLKRWYLLNKNGEQDSIEKKKGFPWTVMKTCTGTFSKGGGVGEGNPLEMGGPANNANHPASWEKEFPPQGNRRIIERRKGASKKIGKKTGQHHAPCFCQCVKIV